MPDKALVYRRFAAILDRAAETGRVPRELISDLPPTETHVLVTALAVGLVDAAERAGIPVTRLIELAEIEEAAATPDTEDDS